MATADERIDDLLDVWEEEFENGRDIPIDELCGDCPSLAPQVEVKIAQLRRLNGMLGQQTQPRHDDEFPFPTENVAVESSFVLNEYIDRGGLGSVFVGRDEMLKREAAVKFLHATHANVPECVKQFQTECEITSRLDHPGIVPIYGRGMLPNGQPFYVMRRISGQTLKDITAKLHSELSQSRPTSSQRVEFHSLLSKFVAVCRTIHYAHCRGVIHRDIKPANIMVGRHGETMVLDWGLAQTVDRDEHHQVPTEETLSLTLNKLSTNTGAGTPIYMSPEQHVGTGEVSILSDVYSLGATLFALMAGEPPFDAETLIDLKNKIVRGDTTKLSYKWLSPALLAICRKAMSVHPEDRYVTALHLARDVERYLADEPVNAYPESVVRRTSRWLSRNRYLSFTLATALLVGLLGSFIYSSVVTRYARLENDALGQAKKARVQSLRLAAGFAANTVALKLSDRWRILEIAAQDPKLIELMENVPKDRESVDWTKYQNKLLRFKESYHIAAGKPESWFLCATDGTQVARVPAGTSIGKSYAHRDYFHGGGNAAPESAANEGTGDSDEETLPPHITGVHRSKVYVSTSTNSLKVALTRPVWSQTEVNPNRKFLGILGVSVSLGEFRELQTGLGSEQLVLVVDTGANAINDKDYRGLLLHHPDLAEKKGDTPPTVDAKLLNEMTTIRDAAAREALENPEEIDHWQAGILQDFVDPLNPKALENEHWISAFAPIVVRGRPINVADTGWGVIVAEREQDDPGIFGFRLKILSGDETEED